MSGDAACIPRSGYVGDLDSTHVAYVGVEVDARACDVTLARGKFREIYFDDKDRELVKTAKPFTATGQVS